MTAFYCFPRAHATFLNLMLNQSIIAGAYECGSGGTMATLLRFVARFRKSSVI
jgi:hypothetical protein